MIIVFSSNEKGALIQMAIKVTEELYNLGRDVICYIPSIVNTAIPDVLTDYVIHYVKAKNFFPYNKYARELAKEISLKKPELVFYVDNGTFSSQVAINIAGSVKQALVMHDAGTSHSSYNNSFKQKIKQYIEKKTSEWCNNRINWIVTCSPSSQNVYSELYPAHKNKVYMLPLGPHLPESAVTCPPEIEGIHDYLMFFGRIDKYKGIDVLLQSFSKYKADRRLVIAGSGTIQSHELQIANSDSRINIINRFIKDEEMPYLFQNCRAVILPYKEATQSGVLPIAYMCGKPIICSNIIGLSQFVKQGVTGFICKNENDYIASYSNIEKENLLKKLSENAYQYYRNNFDWGINLSQMLLTFENEYE